MTSTLSVTDLLANEGIADVTGLWPVELVEDWNRRLDPIFAGTDGERRSYASADALAETGIFAELFSEPVRRLIAGIHPSALLYHCHSYEIAANQGRPHIHRDKPLGWHRDTETIRSYTPTSRPSSAFSSCCHRSAPTTARSSSIRTGPTTGCARAATRCS